MDNSLHHPTASSILLASENISGLDDASPRYSMDTVLRLDVPGGSHTHVSNMKTKRKLGVIDGSKGLVDDSSLFLGLGCSASSAYTKGCSSTAYTTVSSAKEIMDDFSVDFDLDFHLHLGDKRAFNAKKNSCVTPEALEVKRPVLDLDLSLSTGPSVSDVTSVAPSSASLQNNLEMSGITSTVQLVDEGSTSARWKLRQLVPPLHIVQDTEVGTTFDCMSGHVIPPIIPILSSTMIASPEPSVCAPGTHQQQQRNSSLRTCQVMGCGKGARGASGRCISHGGGRRCQKDGCQKGAEGKTAFCKAHGGGRRCQSLGCTKSAEGRTDYCIAHGGGRRCRHEDCTRAARGKSGLCIRHGGGKRCQMENCIKSAEGLSGLCISHGGGRRCQQLGCTKGAQGSTMFCKAHGGGKRCTAPGCTKGAEGSTPFCKGHGGGKRCSYQGGEICPKSVHGGTLYCVRHGGGKRCAMPGCTKSARGRTDHCVRHGGGKRCQHEGCGKSAQGSTDYCKAHGGGKRCSWGQLGYGEAADPCDKFARGKSGLCAAHSSQFQDKQVQSSSISGGSILDPPGSSKSKRMKEIATFENSSVNMMKIADGGHNLVSQSGSGMAGCGHVLVPMHILDQDNFSIEKDGAVQFSLPEGRVHGGGLMAMLTGSQCVRGPSSHDQVVGSQFESGKFYSIPPTWR